MEVKLCECGCGNPTPVASKTNTGRGWLKGIPIRFINGHQWRLGNPKHGQAAVGRVSPTYQSYRGAKERCTSPKHRSYANYGGRGIEFRFASFEAFLAEMGERPEGKSLDRFPNNDGNYEPGNCRWATAIEQNQNRRCCKGNQQ